MTVSPKDTLLIASGPLSDPDKKHLHVAITAACSNHHHILVPICSIPEDLYYDRTCILTPEDHPFIKHSSYVDYGLIKQRHAAHLQKYLENGTYLVKEVVSDDLFKRICNGITESDHTPGWAVKQYKNWPN